MSIKIFKIYIITMIVVLFVFGFKAYAALEITEVMYDPVGSNTNRQWVEVYNNDSSPFEVDALAWRFNDGSSHYMNDKVSFIVPGNSFFVLTNDKDSFLSNNIGYSGLVIDTVLSLDKDGDIVSLLNDGTSIDSFNYTSSMGASEDGNSLQKINGNWTIGAPTPGGENSATVIVPPEEPVVGNTTPPTTTQTTTTSSSGSSSGGSSSVVPKKTLNSKVTTEIFAKTTVASGIIFDLKSETIGLNKETLTRGRFVWNFGDGVVKEDSEPKKISHVYMYPGEYAVTFSYYDNIFAQDPVASDRLIVKVLNTDVVISSVGANTDPYVEIQNKLSNELDLSLWILYSPSRMFVFPKGTVLLGNHSLKLSPRITNFTASDISFLELRNPTNELITSYPRSTQEIQTEKIVSPATTVVKLKESSFESFEKIPQENTVTNLNTLTASVNDANTANVTNKSLAYTGFVVLLLGALVVLIIFNYNQKKNNAKEDFDEEGSDFKIME